MIEPQKYPKPKLVERIQANRDAHRAIFEDAMRGYLDECQKRMTTIGEQISKGKVPSFAALIQLPVPSDHTEDYDAVLDMLDLSLGDEVELNEADFRAYVRDEWRWKREFVGTASTYTALAQ